MHDKKTLTYKKISSGSHLFACLLKLSTGEKSFKKHLFYENQYLIFKVYYENYDLSAGKEKSQLLKSKVCGVRDLPFLPLNIQISNPGHPFASDSEIYLHDGGVFKLDNYIFSHGDKEIE